MLDALPERVFDALGDPTRRRIVERLRDGPAPVGVLAAGLPVGRPAVSKHLKVLEGAGLVEHRGVGTRNLYALAPRGFTALQRWLVQQWDGALDAFAAQVAAREEQDDGTSTDPPPDRGGRDA
ncbi:MAG TPA: metalloregulator ArsR/SmtB family transcription factor [Umezawaea sp.]|nr:metalloregulator ArsR/SmtB family transcription factor [Umezawaea sp.]